jgi:hypothetical protein
MNRRNTKHGQASNSHRSPAYRSWRCMLSRCTNPNDPAFPYYGGRGVTVYPPWRDFMTFFAYMGPRPEGWTIDRYPNNLGNYEPENVRWATRKQQYDNRSSTETFTNAKLTAEQVREIRRLYEQGDVYQDELAYEFNVSQATISGITSGKLWRTV